MLTVTGSSSHENETCRYLSWLQTWPGCWRPVMSSAQVTGLMLPSSCPLVGRCSGASCSLNAWCCLPSEHMTWLLILDSGVLSGQYTLPIDNFGYFADTSWKKALTREACGFGVHHAEPVKLVFAFGADGRVVIRLPSAELMPLTTQLPGSTYAVKIRKCTKGSREEFSSWTMSGVGAGERIDSWVGLSCQVCVVPAL